MQAVRSDCAVVSQNLLFKYTSQYRTVSSKFKEKFNLPARCGTGGISVWAEYNQLANNLKPAVNLGQGFQDFPPPSHITKALAEVASGHHILNQYTRVYGHPRLVKGIAQLYGDLIGRKIDPMEEVLICVGAYEALFCIILGYIEPGDEVILIEPFFDCYDTMVKMAGGTARFIPYMPKSKSGTLTSEDWVLDENELASMFNDKTKIIISNTPHNPIGKVLSQGELETIANLCKKHNVICISDEVYEWFVYEPREHFRMATLPGMWERTITLGSAGKAFSVTGWKIGWAYGPANLMHSPRLVHQNCVLCCATPLQEALAKAFEIEIARFNKPESFLTSLRKDIKPKRDFMLKALKESGFEPTQPEGGYLIIANWKALANKIDLSSEPDKYKDYKFTKKLTKESGVLTIPPSAFYSEQHKHLGEDYIRICFIKKDENLKLAANLLKEWNAKINKQ